MDWRAAAMEFIDACEFREHIEAALITGSYAVGNQHARSDVDVYLVLSDGVNWRERGNRRVGGFLIEYFANPVRRLVREIAEGSNATINMIRQSKVLFDNTGVTKRLLSLCEKEPEIPELSKGDALMQQYFIFDWYDELRRAYDTGSPELAMLYFIFLERAFCFYFSYTRAPMPPGTHLYRWLTDADFRSHYGISEHPDKEFTRILTEGIVAEGRENQIKCAEALYNHVCGDFDIGEFTVRAELPE